MWITSIYIPFGDNESADLVVDINGKLCKIQCKTTSAISEQGTIIWNLRSTIVTTSNKFKTHKYTEQEVDYFVLYHTILELLLIVPIQELDGKSSISFTYPYRDVKTSPNQRNYKEYYLIDFIRRVNNQGD